MFKKKKQSAVREYAAAHGSPTVRMLINAVVTLLTIALLALLVWTLFMFIMPTGSWISVVDGRSMDPNLHSGQVLFTDMEQEIDRGTIVTSYFPNNFVKQNPDAMGVIVVKRVIGVPGDTVVIEPDGVYINGNKIVEDYLSYEAANATYVEGKCNSIHLGDGEYFLMGDNRAESNDSRFFGIVPEDKILYAQSEDPTANFYFKLVILIAMFAVDILAYFLLEFVLTECAYEILYGKKVKNNSRE